jgi:hypothetical protein
MSFFVSFLFLNDIDNRSAITYNYSLIANKSTINNEVLANEKIAKLASNSLLFADLKLEIISYHAAMDSIDILSKSILYKSAVEKKDINLIHKTKADLENVLKNANVYNNMELTKNNSFNNRVVVTIQKYINTIESEDLKWTNSTNSDTKINSDNILSGLILFSHSMNSATTYRIWDNIVILSFILLFGIGIFYLKKEFRSI